MTNKVSRQVVDLNTAPALGRVDVLAYKFAEQMARLAEAKFEVSGIWDAVKPHVHEAVVRGISGLELPTEAKVILNLIQANMGQQPKG
jgi:hypothetical protein